MARKAAISAYTLTGRLREYSSAEPHSHGCHQFLTIRDGVSLLETEHHRSPLYGEMCAFIPAGCLHRSLAVGRDIAYQSLYLPVKAWPRAKGGIVVFTLSELGTALFNRLGADGRHGFQEGTARSCLNLFLKTAAEDMEQRVFELRLPKAQTEAGRRIAAYLEANHSEELGLARMHRDLPYSSRHAVRLFTGDLGITPASYLRLYRLFQASILLRGSTKSVMEIALDCGYSSLSSFYTDFRKHFGSTPRRFRAEGRELGNDEGTWERLKNAPARS